MLLDLSGAPEDAKYELYFEARTLLERIIDRMEKQAEIEVSNGAKKMEEVKQYRKFLTKVLHSQTGWPVDGKNGTYSLTFLKCKMPKIEPLDGVSTIKLKAPFQLRRRLSEAEIDHRAIRAMICLLSYLERGIIKP